ncbi:MAG: SCP2 sterol-binding domain-containing protein [Mycobacteriales bacterium]
MASVDDCRLALDALAARLSDVDADVRTRSAPDRTLALHVSDLEVTFAGRLSEGRLVDVLEDEVVGEKVQLRLQCTSDDLLALTDGSLNPAAAWAAGRLRIDASPLDLLRLRSLF